MLKDLASLREACASDRYSVVESVLSSQTPRTLHTPYLQSLLVTSASHGSADIVPLLHRFGASVDLDVVAAALEPVNSSGIVPVLSELQKLGWDINNPYSRLYTPLARAILTDDLPLVTWMIANGADPIGLKQSRSSLSMAQTPEMAELLLQSGVTIANSGALEEAAFYGLLKVMQFLIDHGADVNEIHKNPWKTHYDVWGTALHAAASQGQVDAVELLLKNGADVSKPDTNGRLPVEYAREMGMNAVVAALAPSREDTDDDASVVSFTTSTVAEASLAPDVPEPVAPYEAEASFAPDVPPVDERRRQIRSLLSDNSLFYTAPGLLPEQPNYRLNAKTSEAPFLPINVVEKPVPPYVPSVDECRRMMKPLMPSTSLFYTSPGRLPGSPTTTVKPDYRMKANTYAPSQSLVTVDNLTSSWYLKSLEDKCQAAGSQFVTQYWENMSKAMAFNTTGNAYVLMEDGNKAASPKSIWVRIEAPALAITQVQVRRISENTTVLTEGKVIIPLNYS